MSCAPVVVFAYNRPQKISDCLECLDRCYLSDISELYIFIDGPSGADQIESVGQVRKIVQDYSSRSKYKNVHISESQINQGLAESVINGVNCTISKYGRVIVVEDDLQVSPYFLTFMNDALTFYEMNESVWSVSGYTDPLPQLVQEKTDVYFGYRASSWGWGTWKNRWDTVKWDLKYHDLYDHRLSNKLRFMRGGTDLPRMLKRQLRGEINSWAIRWCYAQSMQDKLCVFPRETLVNNFGFDGSGTNCDGIGHVDTKEFSSKSKYNFCIDLVNKRLTRAFFWYQEKERIKRYIQRIVGMKDQKRLTD